jgi:CDP-glycerol glycerophosphotransferase
MALIRGRSGRAVLSSTLRIAVQAPRFVASYFARRDRATWVFANVHGFRDSARYMAEHVVNNEPGVTVHWIANSAESAAAAAAAGLRVTMLGDPEATRIQRRAGVAFFSHGFQDLNLPLLSRAFLVYLWHGTPLKRVGLDVNAAQAQRRPLAIRVAARIVRWFHFRAYGLVGLYVAAGELDRERFVTAFGAPAERVKPLGSPRFDVISGGEAYHRLVPGDLRASLGYKPGERLIVWLPTHRREYGDAAWLPALSRDQLDQSLGSDTNVRLLVKTHPNADWEVYRERLPDDPRVRLLRETDVDVNALLHIADGVISDYSSVVFDYAILRRPIYFLAPDIDRYDADRGLYDPYATLTGGRQHADWPSLLTALATDEGMVNWRRVADYCRMNSEPETCRRITQAILAAVTRPK